MTLPGPRPVLHDDKQAPDSAKWASSSNKPHAGGCSVRGNNRSPWLAQAAVRIIETHESEMASCNKSFTSSCFVHFLNNNRTTLPPLSLPLIFLSPLCLRFIISQMHWSEPLGLHNKQREGGRPEMPGNLSPCPLATCVCQP